MKGRRLSTNAEVHISGDYWNTFQETLQQAIDSCNVVTSMIAAHEHHGKCMAEELLDTIDGDVRAIRKLLETIQTPI